MKTILRLSPVHTINGNFPTQHDSTMMTLVNHLNACVAVMRGDEYYHILIPVLLGPVTILAIFLNWFSMKIFKHNSA